MSEIIENEGPKDTGIIRVTASQEEEIEADYADLFVTIRGASLFTGKAALTKAREVAQLVAALRDAGIADSDIHLQGVRAEVASGVLSKISSATYSLKIRCAHLDLIAETLGAVTSQKNTSLQYIAWGYENDEARRLQWLDACITQAGVKAKRIAAGLGVQMTGIAQFTETLTDPEAGIVPQTERGTLGMSRARRESTFTEDLGMEVSHTKLVRLTVNVDYRVAPFPV